MSKRRMLMWLAVFLLPAAVALQRAGGGANEVRADEPSAQQRQPDVPFVPTDGEVVRQMLTLGAVTATDVVYDLGCGDGRIVISAAKQRGARGVGVDIDPKRIAESRQNARAAGVQDRVQFIQSDLFATDVSPATVVTLYLLPEVNLKLRPKLLRELGPGTRVVSHDFDMGDWKPEKTVEVGDSKVHLWVVPANVAGMWTIAMEGGGAARPMAVNLRQKYQNVSGSAAVGGGQVPLTDASLQGADIRFAVAMPGKDGGVLQFRGRVEGDTMRGTVAVAGRDGERPFTATRPARAPSAQSR